MAKRNQFGLEFRAGPDPTTQDVAALGTALAVQTGVRRAIGEIAQRRALEALAGPAALADAVSEVIGDAFSSPQAQAVPVADHLVGAAHQAVVAQLLPAADAAIRLGYRPAGPIGAGMGPEPAGKRRTRKKPSPTEEQPPDPHGPTGDAAGAPGDLGPPAVDAPPPSQSSTFDATGQEVPGWWVTLGPDGCPTDVTQSALAPPGQVTAGPYPTHEAATEASTAYSIACASDAPVITPAPVEAPAYTAPAPTVPYPVPVPVAVPSPVPVYPVPGQPAPVYPPAPQPPAVTVPLTPPAPAPGQPPVWFWPFPPTGSQVPPVGFPTAPALPAAPGPLPTAPGPPVPVPVPPPRPGPAPPPAGPQPPSRPTPPVSPPGQPVPPAAPGPMPAPTGPAAPGRPTQLPPGAVPPHPTAPGPVPYQCPPPVVLQCPACGTVGQAPAPVIQVTVQPAPVAAPVIQVDACCHEQAPAPLVTLPTGGAGGWEGHGPSIVRPPAGASAPPAVELAAFLAPAPSAPSASPPPGLDALALRVWEIEHGRPIAAPAPAPAGPSPAAPAAPAPAPAAPPLAVPDPALGVSSWFTAATADVSPTTCFGDGFVGTAAVAARKTVSELLQAAGVFNADSQFGWVVRAFEGIKDWPAGLRQAAQLLIGVGDNLGGALVELADELRRRAPEWSGCGTPDVAGLAVIQLLAGLVRRWVAYVPESLTRQWDQYTAWACPVGVPTVGEANRALLRGVIPPAVWTCWVRMHGDAPADQAYVVESERRSPEVDQIISLERRGLLSPETDGPLWARAEAGEQWQRELYRRSAEWVPGAGETIHWMAKDLGDPLLTGTFGLFNEFRQKFRGRVRDAARWNGISEEDARWIFASHRTSVSPHQIYEMHKRLRPGWWAAPSPEDALEIARSIAPRRPTGEGGELEQASNLEFLGQQKEQHALYGSDPVAVERFGGRTWVRKVVSPDPGIHVPADLVGLPPQWLDEIGDDPEAARAFLAETVTTGFHAFESLSQSNYPPFWRARLLALSYSVLTRVDIRRAYETGQLDQSQLEGKLQDRGYTPTDARHLAAVWRESTTQLAARRPTANAWVKTGYDAELLRQSLLDNGMRPDMWEDVYRRLSVRRRIEVQQKCLAKLKRLRQAGIVDDVTTLARLKAVGLSPAEAERVRSEWSCELAATPRQHTAAEVCKYLQQQLISPAQAVKLIRRSGYTYSQSRRIVDSCLLKKLPKTLLQKSQLAGAVKAAEHAAAQEPTPPIPPHGEGV